MSLLLRVILTQPAVGPVIAPPPLPPIPKAAPVSTGTKDLFLVRFEPPEPAPGDFDDPAGKALLAKTIRAQHGMITRCYESMLKSRQILGRAAIAVEVGPDGRVVATRVAEDDITDRAVAPCLAHTLRRLRMPPTPKGFTVTLPFVFMPAE